MSGHIFAEFIPDPDAPEISHSALEEALRDTVKDGLPFRQTDKGEALDSSAIDGSGDVVAQFR